VVYSEYSTLLSIQVPGTSALGALFIPLPPPSLTVSWLLGLLPTFLQFHLARTTVGSAVLFIFSLFLRRTVTISQELSEAKLGLSLHCWTRHFKCTLVGYFGLGHIFTLLVWLLIRRHSRNNTPFLGSLPALKDPTVRRFVPTPISINVPSAFSSLCRSLIHPSLHLTTTQEPIIAEVGDRSKRMLHEAWNRSEAT
jgi:hypothetical protein